MATKLTDKQFYALGFLCESYDVGLSHQLFTSTMYLTSNGYAVGVYNRLSKMIPPLVEYETSYRGSVRPTPEGWRVFAEEQQKREQS